MSDSVRGNESPWPKIWWALPLLLLIANAALLTQLFCGSTPSLAESIQRSPDAAPGFPRTVRVNPQEPAVIPHRPMRIVACNAGVADILSALVDAPRIRAVPSLVDEFAGAKDFFAAHPELGRFLAFNAETLLAFQPDLIVTSTFQDPATTTVLLQSKTPIARIESAREFASIRATILTLGEVVGEETRALALARGFDAKLDDIARRVAGQKALRVLDYSNYGVGYAVGAGETEDEIIRRAGARNAVAEAGFRGHVPFTFEQLMQVDPDWLVVAGDNGLESPQAKLLLNEPALAGLRAIRTRRMAVVPLRLISSLSQYTADAVENLARQLYPSAFEGAQP